MQNNLGKTDKVEFVYGTWSDFFFLDSVWRDTGFKIGPVSKPEIFWVMGHCGSTGFARVSLD